MAIRTPFQKHSARQDDASHHMRTRRESRISKPSAHPAQTPKQPLAQGRIACNYLFCIPLKISRYLLLFMAWCGLTACDSSVPAICAAHSFLQRVGDRGPLKVGRLDLPGPISAVIPPCQEPPGSITPTGSRVREQSRGTGGDGCSFQLPQKGSLWLVFSGNLELGLFLEIGRAHV